MIPYGKHQIFPSDIDAVVNVLENEFLTQGIQVPRFEQGLCDYTGAPFAVACNSGTSGLHMACLAAGVGHGDIVWTVPNSFVASANCARYCDADVDFVDIDPVTRNISVQALTEKLRATVKQNKKLPKVLIVVHFAGKSCDMAEIAEICQPYDIVIIEDAAHALGARDNHGNIVGRCQFSAMTVMSFHPVKSITSAEGGAVLTKDKRLAVSLRSFGCHGITRDPSLLGAAHADEAWFYAQNELGLNYRLSDLHAALGCSQLLHLDNFISQRRYLAERYHDFLDGLPLIRPELDSNSAWHLYVIELVEHERKQVFNFLRSQGIGVNVHYIPIHLQPYYQQLGFSKGMYPNAERYYERAITLPLYPSLKKEEQAYIVAKLHEMLGRMRC